MPAKPGRPPAAGAAWHMAENNRVNESKNMTHAINNGETVFIGTSHIDPDGHAHLAPVLDSAGPDLVLLEVSRFSLILRRTYGAACRIILEHNIKKTGTAPSPEIRNIRNYFDIPYEYSTVRAYCTGTGAKYILVDVSIFSLARFIHAYSLVTRKNITAAAGVHEDRFILERRIAGSIFSGNDSLLRNMKLSRFRSDPMAMRRERIILSRVTRIANANRDKRIAWVGGWEHLLDDPCSDLLYAGFRLPGRRCIAFLEGDIVK